MADSRIYDVLDISVTGPNQYTYWWYSNFTVQSSETHPTTHYWLHLHGIHYEAQVFLNGFEISPNTGEAFHSFIHSWMLLPCLVV